ncbi:class I lanthipeptide [Kordia zhangzhouensis]|uniref:class I lanthipeptide n=1 Tax=Kordia zhangzhouensis TaxID=1620405 RepID=UPI0012FCE0E4|nr:class I lanthipeptide [Kordia zhangzhouensis]
MKKQTKKIAFKKTTVTELNRVAQTQIKGGATFTFLNCLSRGDCTAGTGVLCY